jgi:serine/threonine protein kinase
VKLADFGMAKSFLIPISQYTIEVATLHYRAPEILLGNEQYSLSADTWAVGLIFAELVNGQTLIEGDSEIDQIFKIFQIFGTPTEEEWKGISNVQ